MKLSALSLVMLTSVTAYTTSATAQLAPSSAQLVQLPAPNFAIEKQPVHFSQAINATSAALNASDGYQSLSDEYWLEVDGRSLNNGIGLNLNQPEAIIRLSAKQSLGDNLPDAHAIDPQFLELRKDKQLIKKAFSQRVSQEQMATASILANSSAVKVSQAAGTGKFQLRVAQSLAPNQKYIVNVKEKGSAYRQALSTKRQTYLAGDKAQFSAKLLNQDTALTDTRHRTFLKAPNGEMTEVKYLVENGNYSVELPSTLPENSRGQLFELHVASQSKTGNRQILRNGKIAFAVATPTARMTIEQASLQGAKVNLDVASEGRYAVSGIVYGQDKFGEAQPLMHSSSAYYLEPGQQTIELQFDQSIIQGSGLTPPFTLRSAKLMDQSRISTVQHQAPQQPVTLEEPEATSNGGAVSLISLLALAACGGITNLARRRKS